MPRHEYTLAEVRAIHDLPIPDLVLRAQLVHREHHPANEVQLCSLLSVKTGGCPEDCAYCPQAAHYDTGLERERMMKPPEVLDAAARAKAAGATRFCMGAAWREVKDGPAFDEVLEMVRGVRALGMEACCTLGMLNETQAQRLAEAGLTAYNHNLDTSQSTTGRSSRRAPTRTACARSRNVRKAGITVCSGGIIGMGESVDDRCGMLVTLANLDPQPESVPVNALVPVEGTPLADRPPGRRPGAGADDRHRAHPDAGVAGAPVGGAAWRCRARRSCCACWRARTRSSSARSCSPPATRTCRRTSRCCATPGLRAAVAHE